MEEVIEVKGYMNNGQKDIGYFGYDYLHNKEK